MRHVPGGNVLVRHRPLVARAVRALQPGHFSGHARAAVRAVPRGLREQRARGELVGCVHHLSRRRFRYLSRLGVVLQLQRRLLFDGRGIDACVELPAVPARQIRLRHWRDLVLPLPERDGVGDERGDEPGGVRRVLGGDVFGRRRAVVHAVRRGHILARGHIAVRRVLAGFVFGRGRAVVHAVRVRLDLGQLERGVRAVRRRDVCRS